MTIKDVLWQLESLRANSADFARAEDADPIWQQDIDALDETAGVLAALCAAGADTMQDAEAMARDYPALLRKCRARRIFHCPQCGYRHAPDHGYCKWCGAYIGKVWDTFMSEVKRGAAE